MTFVCPSTTLPQNHPAENPVFPDPDCIIPPDICSRMNSRRPSPKPAMSYWESSRPPPLRVNAQPPTPTADRNAISNADSLESTNLYRGSLATRQPIRSSPVPPCDKETRPSPRASSPQPAIQPGATTARSTTRASAPPVQNRGLRSDSELRPSIYR